MARKTLLTEGEIRQFMKLANLAPLGHGRLEEMHPGVHAEEEEELEMDMEMGGEDAPVDDVEMDMDLDAAAEAPAEASAEELVMDLLDLVKDWAQSHDVDMSVEGDVDADEVEVADMGDEVDAEMDATALDDEEAMVDDTEEELPAARDGMYEATREDVVNEVARRVAARLKAVEDQDKLAEQLANRILSRISNGAK
jgi:hypothetical protein